MVESKEFEVIFLGTGVSTAIPNLGHILHGTDCEVCIDATNNPSGKNKRNNVSIAITYADDNNVKKCMIVDVGKTMREGFLKFLAKYRISGVNSILLTHGHADAIFGLDDVRDFQRCDSVEVSIDNCVNTGFRLATGPLPIYLNSDTMSTVTQVFKYLTDPPDWLDEERCILKRRVACLNFNVIDSNSSMSVDGLSIRCFPVYHGGTYVSLGFSFGKEGEFVYISDVKIIPPETMEYLLGIRPRIRTLVIDALDKKGIYSHMGLHEALEVIAQLQPEKAYLTGISCGMGLHDDCIALLAKLSPNTTVAYDGMHLSGFEM